MKPEQVVVSDDWTKNWQAKIAVKTTAIFLWMVIAVSFFGMVMLTQNMEAELAEEFEKDLKSLTLHIQQYLIDEPLSAGKEAPQALRQLVESHLKESNVAAIALRLGNHNILFNEVDPSWHEREIAIAQFNPGWYEGRAIPLSITGYHLAFDELAGLQRNRILFGIALAVVAIGIFLSWTIHKILDKPFAVIMEATQQVSEGNLDVRLEVDRDDEFGKLSLFYNQMLERFKEQQNELTLANEELLNEITVRRNAEFELTAHQDQLEQQIEERTRDLQEARDQALAASQTKSAFVANISHEIRTPLTPIIGFAEALLEDNLDQDVRRNSLKAIIRNSRHLLMLINDILDLSKIEANKLDVETIAVSPFEVIQDIATLSDIQSREKGLLFKLEYHYPMPSEIVTDPLRLKQILMNLISNAIKFTDRGHIRMSTRYDPDHERLYITVKDTGMGISPDKRERLFQAFSQADATTTREFGGTGLGLYISQRLSILLGGNIEMSSEVGKGSSFTLHVSTGPVTPEKLLYEEPDSSIQMQGEGEFIEPGSKHGRVLLAEDSKDNQQLISHYLKRIGADVAICDNGKQAVEMAFNTDFDLILMDMQMPIMGGLEAVEILRAMGNETPIYALTANAMKEDIEAYGKIGCDGFLAKPIEKIKFNQVMQRYLFDDNASGVSMMLSSEDEDDKEIQALVTRFREGLPEHASKLQMANVNEDWDTMQQIAHTLKGMGGAFGFPEITESADSLERVLKQQDMQNVAHCLDSLLNVLTSSMENA